MLTDKMMERLLKRAGNEMDSVVKELENALAQIKFQRVRFVVAASLDEKAECLDAVNRYIRQMKSHVNETAVAYIAGMIDGSEIKED